MRNSRTAGDDRWMTHLVQFAKGACQLTTVFFAAALPAISDPVGLTLPGTDFENPPPVNPGWMLLAEANCAACHDPGDRLRSRILFRGAPDIENVGARLAPRYLRAFLSDPQQARPGTPMPDLLHGIEPAARAGIVEDLVHFLVSAASEAWPNPIAADSEQIAQGNRLYHTIGCVACHQAREASGNPASNGEASAPVSALAVSLDGLQTRSNVRAVADYLVNPKGRMPAFDLSAGDAAAIGMYLLQDQISELADGTARFVTAPDRDPFSVDKERAEQGRTQFGLLGCANCHDSDSIEATGRKGRSLTDLAGFTSRGCLSETVRAPSPRFAFSAAQRDRLRTLLDDGDSEKMLGAGTAESAVVHAMASLHCYACHARNGFGGPNRARRRYFISTVADAGDEGRIPPHLTGVGAKLQSGWLQDVLFHGASVRPYMTTQMPRFKRDELAHLADAFADADMKTDRASRAMPIASFDKPTAEAGRELVSMNGLACIGCHTFAGHQPLGVPAPDLASVPQRVRHDWFHAYLPDPAAARPGTRMPSFWPEGYAINRKTLEGDAQRQIEAIWMYLSAWKQIGVPPGLPSANRDP